MKTGIPSFTTAILVGLYVFFSHSGSHAINLDSLFVQSIGGPASLDSLRQIRSMRATGWVSINNMEGRFIQYFMAPNRFYLEVNFEHFSLIQAFDGQNAWQKDLSGNISELHGYEERELFKSIYLDSYAYLFPERMDGSYQYIGLQQTDSADYHQVAFYPLNRDTVQVYFSAATGRRVLLISHIDNLVMTSISADFRNVAGVMMPYYTRATADAVSLVTEFRVDSVTVNPSLAPSLFSMPGFKTGNFRFHRKEAAMIMPIVYKSGHLRLKGTINGRRKAWFILDSGASTTILHAPTFAEMNLKVVGSLPAVGLGGYDEAALVLIDSLIVGNLTIYDQVAGQLDMTGLARPIEDSLPFGGLLGYDFLSSFPIMIDYRGFILTVFNPDSFTLPPGGIEVEFTLTMQIPTVTADANGLPGQYLVDLGNSFGLILNSRFYAQHFGRGSNQNLSLKNVKESSDRFQGIGGAVGSRTALLDRFRLGDVVLDSLQVIIPDSAAGLAGSGELAGNIGNLVLENFRLLFDYHGSRLIFYSY